MTQEFAPGLPSKTEFSAISNKPGKTRLVIQKHYATNTHYDMRLKDGDKAHSWVIRALPGERDKMLAVQQPTHTAKYMNFQGKIESGYGAGTVKKVYDKKVKIISADANKIKFKSPEGTFTMIRPGSFENDKHWLMIKSAYIQMKDIEKDADFNWAVIPRKVAGTLQEHVAVPIKHIGTEFKQAHGFGNKYKVIRNIPYSPLSADVGELGRKVLAAVAPGAPPVL